MRSVRERSYTCSQIVLPVSWCLSSIYRRGEAGQGETEEEQELEGGGRGGDVGGAQAGQAKDLKIRAQLQVVVVVVSVDELCTALPARRS